MECNFENCGYYVDEECTICGMGTDGEDTFCKYCKDNPNCYYKQLTKLKVEDEKLKFKLDTVEADYEASEIEIEDLKNKLNLLTTANNHLLELDKYRQKELETKAEATKSNIHNLALLSKANKTLQEIKAIVCGNYEIIGPQGRKDILKLITKAEEE